MFKRNYKFLTISDDKKKYFRLRFISEIFLRKYPWKLIYVYSLLVTFQNLIDYFPWWCRIDSECSFQVEFNFDHGMVVARLRNTVFFNLFFIFQFSRMLGVLHGGIVASLSRLRRICSKLQSIAYVATEFIEKSTWYMSLKTIDFPPIRKFYCSKFVDNNYNLLQQKYSIKYVLIKFRNHSIMRVFELRARYVLR